MLTNEISDLVNEIENKIRQLIDEKNSVSLNNSLLERKNEELQRKIEEKEIIIKQLKDNNNYIRISQSVKQSEGNTDVKNKIDELVREIDKCIGLLNK
jgi:sugar-specific transcriptional regulator TrmB